MLGKNLCVVYHDPISPEWFQQTLETLSRHYKFISAEELEKYYQNNLNIKNFCHITFDDGCRSVYDYAWPVLQRKGIPASLFVSPKKLEKNDAYWFQKIQQVPKLHLYKLLSDYIADKDINIEKYHPAIILKAMDYDTISEIVEQSKKFINKSIGLNISINELKELKSSGVFEIGAHTINHPILHNETDDKSFYEISDSIEKLEKILNQRIKYFAYPNGIKDLDYSEREFNILEKNNINLAFTTEHRFIRKSDYKYEVPRIDISNGSPFKISIKSIILPYFQWLLNKVKRNSEKNQRRRIKKIKKI